MHRGFQNNDNTIVLLRVGNGICPCQCQWGVLVSVQKRKGASRTDSEKIRLNFPSFADHHDSDSQCTAIGPAAHYEILDLVNVYQPVHGFTTMNDVFIDSTMLIAFERMRSCFVCED